MKMLTPQRMAQYDEYAIKKWGIPSAVLMENAGRSTYRLAKEKGYLDGAVRIAIVCGRGNNGGDGFVMARYALMDGFKVKVYLLGKRNDLKGDAALNMGLFSSLGGEIFEAADLSKPPERWFHGVHLIIDAIFGTGLSKPIEGLEKNVIDAMNASGKPIIAVDIPSGVDGKTGAVQGIAVKAAHTFTFAYPKPGHMLFPGAYHRGKLAIIDISIPRFIEEKLDIDGYIVDGEMLRSFIKARLPWSHKGTYGNTAVIAGSIGKTGAAAMTAQAALKIGAGLVTLAVPASLNAILEEKLTEVMTYPVKDSGEGCFPASAYDALEEFANNKDVVVIGPGLSQAPGTQELTRNLVSGVDKPFVIDADGINAFQGHLDMLKNKGSRVLITPHPGEFSRITGISTADVNADRIGTGKRFVETYGINLLLKGAPTVLFTADGEVFVNPTGNPSLAKGGSGDILTGFIGGLVSQGYTLSQAAVFGAYIHGYMADKWVEANDNRDLLAGDLLLDLGRNIKEIESGKERVYIERSL